MTEPTKQVEPSTIIISPGDPKRHRVWPDPRHTSGACWLAFNDPDALTREQIRELARAAEAYRHVFQASRRDFLPAHAAIRAHLAGRGEVST